MTQMNKLIRSSVGPDLSRPAPIYRPVGNPPPTRMNGLKLIIAASADLSASPAFLLSGGFCSSAYILLVTALVHFKHEGERVWKGGGSTTDDSRLRCDVL